MKSTRFIMGGIIGGVVFFLLGWLVYGMLLSGFMKEHINSAASSVMYTDENMILWSLAIGNIALGLLVAYAMDLGNINSVSGGATTGAIIGFLFAAAMDFTLFSQINIWDMTGMIVDIVVMTLLVAVMGAAIGWWYGRGKKPIV
jgi:uncharacterized membrane protein